MNEAQLTLYQRIQDFQFDDTNASLSFSRRLARDNRWSLQYTQRVIEEYRKFVFLAVAAGHLVTPSDAVDQVWHWHLLNTHAYWNEFCPNILKMPLHHSPTNGTMHDKKTYYAAYKQTLKSYIHFFKENPPEDIWSNSEQRFGQDTAFVRVNSKQYWFITKPVLPDFKIAHHKYITALPLLICFTVLITGCTIIKNADNSLSLSLSGFLNWHELVLSWQNLMSVITGTQFLGIYGVIGYIFYLAASAFKKYRLHALQPIMMNNELLNPEQLAYLKNGHDRVIDYNLVDLIEREYLKLSDDKKSIELIKPYEPKSNIQKLILDTLSLGAIEIHVLLSSLKESTIDLRDDLVSKGLLIEPKKADRIRHEIGLLLTPFILFGLVRLFYGIHTGHSVFFLIILIIIAIFTPFYVISDYEKNEFGRHILEQHYQLNSEKDNTLRNSLSFALLITGLSVLNNTALADFSTVLTQQRNLTNGGGDGGGGGCGGCGGCGG